MKTKVSIVLIALMALGCWQGSKQVPEEAEGTEQSRLKAAIWAGDEAKVRELLDANADLVNTPDDTLNTPLHNAAAAKHAAIVKLLLERGADVNAMNDEDQTPLTVAVMAQAGDEIIELLKSNGAVESSV